MRPAILWEDELVIPADSGRIDAFREWARSDAFPERGRIDFLDGTLEIDMSPEELQSHGALKSELHAALHRRVKAENLGQLFIDRARLSNDRAGLSCEPDLLLISLKALREGRSRYLSGSRPERLIEIEGSAALVVEILSDSSAGKDRKRLPPLYAAAGVEELWLVDARSGEISFHLCHLVDGEFRSAPTTEDGFAYSRVLDRHYRIRREPWEFPGTWSYQIDER
ncbi:MAG: Uma2 family endonuclease [Vulcanimicrobiota bacterium]